MNEFVVILTMFLDPICALMLVKVLISSRNGMNRADSILRICLVVAIAGLVGQSLLSYQHFRNGLDLGSAPAVWWVGKDIAINILAIYLFFEFDYSKARAFLGQKSK